MVRRFRDRTEAGRLLARELTAYVDRPDVIVLALPRGGVPVGYEVAQALHAPLDIILVRKLGVPGYEELAMGAIASGGIRVLNDMVVTSLRIPPDAIELATSAETAELQRRERAYRGNRPPLAVGGRTVILVDDGLATGSTMRAAITALSQQAPAKLIVAVPVAPEEACAELSRLVDAVACPVRPTPLYSVGYWYDDFAPTSDADVRWLLECAAIKHAERRDGAETRAVAT